MVENHWTVIRMTLGFKQRIFYGRESHDTICFSENGKKGVIEEPIVSLLPAVFLSSPFPFTSEISAYLNIYT